jgi:hypothetical protein
MLVLRPFSFPDLSIESWVGKCVTFAGDIFVAFVLCFVAVMGYLRGLGGDNGVDRIGVGWLHYGWGRVTVETLQRQGPMRGPSASRGMTGLWGGLRWNWGFLDGNLNFHAFGGED